jgi:hypothetical protein
MSFQINKPEGSIGRVELSDETDPMLAGFATVWSTGAHHAPLLAAAPDLLEALKEVVRVFDSNPSSICDTVWVTGDAPETLYDLARAAIAKAEGAA